MKWVVKKLEEFNGRHFKTTDDSVTEMGDGQI